jgi:protein O-GlcNAc transferase
MMNTLTTPEAAFSEAIRLLETGALTTAEAAFERLLTILPEHHAARFLLGLCRFRQGRADSGLQTMQEALEQAPAMPLGQFELGRCLIQAGRPADALICMDDAIAVAPAFANAHFERGNLLQRLGRADESVAAYDIVITLEPQRAAAHHRRANALHRLGRLDAALAAYDAAITLQPGLADAHADRGLLLQRLGRADEALASYDHAILIDRGHAAAHYNRGNLLHDLKRLDESLAAYDRALALVPAAAGAHNNRGLVLRDLWHIDAALAAFDRALEIDPDFAGAHANRGGIFLQREDFVAALAALGNALRLDGTEEYALGDWLHVKMNLCDWVDLEPALATLRARIDVGERVTYPFPALSLPTTPAQQLAIARSFVAHRFPARPLLPSGPKRRDAADRIRIAYFSSDLRNHPVAYLMAGVFEHHDRTRFEILAISSGPSPDHPMRRRMESAFDRFIDVGDRPDDEVAAMARDLDIDIAIDLNGLTGDSRIGVFARRPAPIQVAYIGFPGTSGADYIDYAIADRISVPPEQRAHFSEKIVYLPNCFQANDSTKQIADLPLS